MTENGTRILVVEDEVIVSADIQACLENLGYAVTAAVQTGEEAITSALAEAPDVVLMDIRLKGGMDGVEAATRIRELANIPIIYLTAYADESTVQRAKASAPYGYILKPFGENDLHSNIQMAIYKHRLDGKLKEREQWFATTLRSIGDAVITTDPAGRVSFMNPIAETLTGWQADEARGRALPEVFRIIDEQTRQTTANPAAEVVSKGATIHLKTHTSLIARDGAEKPIADSAAPIRDEKGELLGVVLIFKDITERRRLEEELRQTAARLAEAQRLTQLGSWEWDLVSDTVFWSEQTYRNFGVAPGQFGATFEDFLRIVHPEDRERVRLTITQALAERSAFDFEHRIIRPDGKTRSIHSRGEVVLDERGEPAKMIGTEQDVTEHKLLEEQLLQSQKMESLGVMAGGIAHHFNNLLTVIVGYANLLLQDHPPPDARHLQLKSIKKAADSAAALTRQMLTFAQKQIFSPRLCDLNVLLKEAAPRLHALLGERHHLLFNLDPEPAFIKADSRQIEQALKNLVLNARDAMRESGFLFITTTERDVPDQSRGGSGLAAGRYVVLEVRDTGGGMDEETRSHLFEPFYTTKDVGQGVGLGLSTVYGIVKQSGGEVKVFSEAGQGTTVKIFLPAVAQTPPVEVRSVKGEPPRGGETLLLVEEERMVREVTRRLIELYGYRVLEATSVAEALRIAEQHDGPIHLLITDLQQPEMRVDEFYSRLIKLHPGMRVLYLTDYADDRTENLAAQRSESALVQKPFDLDILARRIREVLDGRWS